MGCSASVGIDTKGGNYAWNRGFTLLLLGTANCGKTTLLKQMKILHKGGFSEDERREFSSLVIENIVESLLAIIDKVSSDPGLCFKDPAMEESASMLKAQTGVSISDMDLPACVPFVITLLNDPVIAQCMLRHRSSIPNLEAANFFFGEIQRISGKDFVPSNNDILYTRFSTTGVNELNFDFDNQKLTLIDVGGQRTMRDKWASCFDGINCLIFCVSLDDYSCPSKDDPYTTALDESLDVFEGVVNNNWFKSKDILLFLNKRDVFENVLDQHPLSRYCKDFDGDATSFQDSYKYILALYLARNKNTQRNMYAHATCAVDTRNVELVFCVAMDSVLKRGAQQFGLL